MIETEFLLQLQAGSAGWFGLTFDQVSQGFGTPTGDFFNLRAEAEVYDAVSGALLNKVEFDRSGTRFSGTYRTDLAEVASSHLRVKTYAMSLSANTASNEPRVHALYFEFGARPVPEPHATTAAWFAALALGRRSGRRFA